MQFRLYGLLIFAIALLVLWYFKPGADGRTRYPKKYGKHVDRFVPLIVVALIGIALPFIAFGTPGALGISNSTP